jgi:hypothetical protein
MDPAFELEKWLLQAGIEQNLVTNVAAKLREEECASVSALKMADEATLQSIGIKAGSRRLILTAANSLDNSTDRNPSSTAPLLETRATSANNVGFATAATAASTGPPPYQDVHHESPEELPSTVFTQVFKSKNQTVSPWKRFLESGVYWYTLCISSGFLLYS